MYYLFFIPTRFKVKPAPVILTNLHQKKTNFTESQLPILPFLTTIIFRLTLNISVPLISCKVSSINCGANW